jgi:hypothetical protein
LAFASAADRSGVGCTAASAAAERTAIMPAPERSSPGKHASA